MVFLVALAFPATATTIPVTNNSFEDPPLNDGVFIYSIPGWTITGGDAGVWNPKAFQSSATDPPQYFVDHVPDGIQVAWSNNGDFMQTVSASVTPGFRYTLIVWVGGRSAVYSNKPYGVILAGTNQLPGAAITGNNPTNDWRKDTVTYTSQPGDLNAGQSLSIRLMNYYDGGQVNFDKVTLDSAYVVACQGFLPPFDNPLILKSKDSRAIPVKMVLKDLFGNIITDAELSAPPVVNVTYDTSEIIPGYDADLVPPGLSDDGNAFRYDPVAQLWILNLATKQFKAAGNYTVTVKAGDSSYVIDPACSQTFTRQ
jgi:hypothetical protein